MTNESKNIDIQIFEDQIRKSVLGFKKGHFFVVDNNNLGWITIKVKNI